MTREEQERAWIKLGKDLEKDMLIVRKEEGQEGKRVYTWDTEEMLYRIRGILPNELDQVFITPAFAYYRMSKPSPETALMEHLEGVERELTLLEKEHPDFNKKIHIQTMLRKIGENLLIIEGRGREKTDKGHKPTL